MQSVFPVAHECTHTCRRSLLDPLMLLQMAGFMYLRVESSTEAATAFRLHDFKDAEGGGRLHERSTLAELGLSTLEMQQDLEAGGGIYVPVAFDDTGLSVERFKANAADTAVLVRGKGTYEAASPSQTRKLVCICHASWRHGYGNHDMQNARR